MKHVRNAILRQKRLIRTEKWGVFYFFPEIDRAKKKLARLLNFWIALLWMPGLVIGFFPVLCRIASGLSPSWKLGSFLLGFALAPCATIIFHELGHAVAALAYEVKVVGIGLVWQIHLSGYTKMSVPSNLPGKHHIRIDAAGIKMNLLLAGTFFGLSSIPHFLSAFWFVMGLYNFSTGIVNLCPVNGLDGFHILSLCLGDENILAKANCIVRIKGKSTVIKKGGIDSFLAVTVSYLLEGMQILRFLVPIFGFWMILEQFLFSIPPVLGIVSAISHSLFWGAISLFFILGAVALNPLCKGKEVLWIFVLTSFATLPCNVIFMLYFYKIPYTPTLFHIFVFCVGFLIRYLLVLSMEEIVFCRIGYWIWGK